MPNIDMQLREKVISEYDLSSEQVKSIDIYLEELIRWQKTTQLIAPTTLPDIWSRHVEDSLQLSSYYLNKSCVMDIGSGGGFPGLITAIMQPHLKLYLVESLHRKAVFLKTVIRMLGLNAEVICERIEKLNWSNFEAVDLVQARALASLDQLLDYVYPLLQNSDRQALFMKGQGADEEISVARAKWVFEVKEKISETDSRAKLLLIRHLSKK